MLDAWPDNRATVDLLLEHGFQIDVVEPSKSINMWRKYIHKVMDASFTKRNRDYVWSFFGQVKRPNGEIIPRTMLAQGRVRNGTTHDLFREIQREFDSQPLLFPYVGSNLFNSTSVWAEFLPPGLWSGWIPVRGRVFVNGQAYPITDLNFTNGPYALWSGNPEPYVLGAARPVDNEPGEE